MRHFDTDLNVATYFEDGYNKLLPKQIREKFDGKTVKVAVSSYPYYHNNRCEDKVVEVKSPKYFDDIIDAWTDYLLDIDEIAKEDNTWECLHSADCLWVEGIGIDAKNLNAVVYFGS